jgi:hypothetical protein
MPKNYCIMQKIEKWFKNEAYKKQMRLSKAQKISHRIISTGT